MSPCNVVVLTMSCCSWFSISILLLIPLSTWRNIRDLRRQNGRQGVRDPRWAGVALPFVRKTRRSAQVIPQIPLKWIVKKKKWFSSPWVISKFNSFCFSYSFFFSYIFNISFSSINSMSTFKFYYRNDHKTSKNTWSSNLSTTCAKKKKKRRKKYIKKRKKTRQLCHGEWLDSDLESATKTATVSPRYRLFGKIGSLSEPSLAQTRGMRR